MDEHAWRNSNGRRSSMEYEKRGLATWEEYKNTVRACRAAMRMATAHLELNLVKEAKVDMKASSSMSTAKVRLGKMWTYC